MVPEARALSMTPGPLPRYQLHATERVVGMWKQADVGAAAKTCPRDLPDRPVMMQILQSNCVTVRVRSISRAQGDFANQPFGTPVEMHLAL